MFQKKGQLGHRYPRINTDKKESMFRLRRERTPSKQAATYAWTWFRRQAFCTNLWLSVQIRSQPIGPRILPVQVRLR